MVEVRWLDEAKGDIKAGRIVEEINKPEIREIIEGNYGIIYRIVTDSTVDILMIHHGARDFTRRMPKN